MSNWANFTAIPPSRFEWRLEMVYILELNRSDEGRKSVFTD